MNKYHLGFISDEDIFNHVKETVQRYSANIDLKEFNKNIIDPIKLTFDAKVYGRTMEEVVAAECIRQMDKSNNNHIGYFHQNLFRYAGNGWSVPTEGFDIVNEERHIYAYLFYAHEKFTQKDINSMLIRCFDKKIREKEAVFYVVDVNDHSRAEEAWRVYDNIDSDFVRLVSIDRFYEIAFPQEDAYRKLCDVLPQIVNDL